MAQNYTSVPERNLAGGLNQQASEDSIPDGYVENAINVTVNTEGLMKKRPGFRTYLGHLPIRVAKLSWDHTKATDNLTFELTSGEHANVDIDLSNVASTALLVVGRTSTPVSTGPEFNAAYTYRYYTGFTANPRKVIQPFTTNTLAYLQSEHGYTTKDLFVGLAKSDNPTNKSNTQLLASSVTINQTTYDVSVGYSNDANPVAIPAFVYALPLSGIAGTSYAALHNSSLVAGIHTITIPAATHNLNSFNILTRCYDTTLVPGSLVEVLPNEVYVDSNTGEVKLEFSEAQTNLRVLLHIPNIGNQYIDAIAAYTQSSFTIPNLQGNFIFLDCFIKPTPTSTIRRRVIPTDVQVDVLNSTATVTFDNEFNLADNLVLIWDYAVVKTTKFSVTAQTTLTSSGQDVEPELSIYGLLAEEIYPETLATQSYNGWVQHVDTYKTEGNTTLVAGMGWNLFRGMPRDFASPYLATPILYPSLRSRALNATTLAPAFHGLNQTVSRTRGGLQFLGGGEGWGQIQSITWNAALGGYDVVIPTPSLAVTGTPVQSFTSTQPYGDMLTIQGAELSSFNGSWAILSSIYVTSLPFQHVTFTIKTSFESSDYNCGQAGEAGIFTDVLQLETTTPLLLTRGDTFSAQSFPSGLQLGFVGYFDQASVRYVFVDNVTESATLSAGQLLVCSRESKYCYGIRTLEGGVTGFNQANNLVLVRGDSLEITGLGVALEVSRVLSETHSNLQLTVEDGVGTLSNIPDARRFAIGQRILITQLGLYSGEYSVTDVASSNTEITLDCTGVPNIVLSSITIPPHFELRETLSFSDDSFNRNYFAIEGRWECIEQPQIDTANKTRYALIEPTVTEHFDALDYGGQLPIRSTMSQDNLYLTNGTDPVQKYDGIATYRAGLPRWNTQLYISSGNSPSTALSAGTYSYYFRLGAIDENETNIITAVTGIEDYKITISGGHSIHLRLVSFPNWDEYDFEKISLEIYRTKVNLPGEYFLVTRLEMPQLPSGGYIEYVDTLTDAQIESQGKDLEVGITQGYLVGATNLSEPLRAKYMTSIDGRLVLANLRDWQRIDLNFSKTIGILTASDFVGNTLLLHNNSADAGTTTDMLNRVGFAFVGSANRRNISSTSYTSNLFQFTVPQGTPAITPIVGDWVYLTSYGNTNSFYQLTGTGWWQIRSVTASGTNWIIQVYMPSFDLAKKEINVAIFAPNGTKHVPVYLGVTSGSLDDDAWRMVNGTTDSVIQITLRLAAAVNACMRQVDVALNGYAAFKPWIMADAGSEFNAGQINFVRPKESSLFFSITLPAFGSEVRVEHLGIYKTGTIIATQRRFPSRVLFSYKNFPELFNHAADVFIDESAASNEPWPIEVNPADGQEITGIVPFFGESTVSGATREAMLVVFKSNSIYVVDIDTRKVQKIESNGLGCTAPYSIAPTKDGIMFANESGIYKFTRAQSVEPVGQFLDRVWRSEVDRANLGLAHGHHYGIARQYKLSAPTANLYNEDVFVYEHTRESRGQVGSWTRYTNHLATGWCNLFDQEFFGTTKGRVCILKDSGTKWDFSDRGEAITAEVVLRSNDFGIPNVRKKLLHLSVHFRNPQEEGVNLSQESTEVYVAADLVDNFIACNKYEGGGLFVKTGLSDTGLLKGETIRFNVPITKAIRFQPRITNSGLYETLEFSGVTYRVAGLTTKGTKEAKDTQ